MFYSHLLHNIRGDLNSYRRGFWVFLLQVMEDIGAHSWLQALTGRVNIVDQVHIGSQVTTVQTGWLIDMIVSEQPG